MLKALTALLLAILLPLAASAQQDDCPAGHVRHPQVSPLDHDYMVSAFKASFRGLFGRDPSMQPGSGKDDGEYYIAAANHYGVYGDDQCHAGWSGYWESWLDVGHGDLGRVQTSAHYLPFTPTSVPTPIPVPTPVPTPQPILSVDLTPILTQQMVDHAAEMAILQELRTQVALARQDIAEFRAAVRSRWVAIMDSPIVKYGLAAIAGFIATHKWGG